MISKYIFIVGGIYLILLSGLHARKIIKPVQSIWRTAIFGRSAIGKLMSGIGFFLIGITLYSEFQFAALFIIYFILVILGIYFEYKASLPFKNTSHYKKLGIEP